MTKSQFLLLISLLILLICLLPNSLVIGSTNIKCSISSIGTIVESTEPTFSFILSSLENKYFAKNGITGEIIYEGLNATAAANRAIENAAEGNQILFRTGIFILNGSIQGEYKHRLTIIFEKDASIKVGNQMNAPAIELSNVCNWSIENATIFGNSKNQELGHKNEGIYIESSINCSVNRAEITDCQQYGFFSAFNTTNCGIRNSRIFDCKWNGITLGMVYGNKNPGKSLYAENNEVAYCGDVGISSVGEADIVRNNLVHDINGTNGYNNANWGIASEGGSGHTTILENRITNCKSGIVITGDYGSDECNVIMSNIIRNVERYGINVGTAYNDILKNVVEPIKARNGIISASNNNQIIANNVSLAIKSSVGIILWIGDNCSVRDNNIQIEGGTGIKVNAGYGNNIQGNRFMGFCTNPWDSAININSEEAQYTIVEKNDFDSWKDAILIE